MSELRFHTDLYAKEALEDAVETYGDFGCLELSVDAPHLILTISEVDEEYREVLPLEILKFAFIHSFHLEKQATS